MKVVHCRNIFFVAHKKKSTWWFCFIVWSAITERNNAVHKCTALTHSDNKTANAKAEKRATSHTMNFALTRDCNFGYQRSQFYNGSRSQLTAAYHSRFN